MGFEMELPELDPFNLQYQYRLYWVEENDQYYTFDELKQPKVKREILSMKESAIEQFEELDESVICKILVNNCQIIMQHCQEGQGGKYISECKQVAFNEGWLK